jgi:hypothetical protein
MGAFCRQHAKIDGENPSFWLAEAHAWEKLQRSERLSDLDAEDRRKDTAAEMPLTAGSARQRPEWFLRGVFPTLGSTS